MRSTQHMPGVDALTNWAISFPFCSVFFSNQLCKVWRCNTNEDKETLHGWNLITLDFLRVFTTYIDLFMQYLRY